MANWRSEVNNYSTTADVSANGLVARDYEVPDTARTAFTVYEQSSSFTSEMEQDSNSNLSNIKESGFDQEEDTFQTDVEESKVRPKDKFNVECLSYELQVGYRILSNMMSTGNRCVNKLFLYPVDDKFPETSDYYDKIKEPIWMFKMKEKFEKQKYSDLTEFMADFRLMIENCYRYNGPDHFVSKKAQKLEMMMKQKVALLSKDLRDKIAGASTANSEDDLLASAGLRRRIKNPNMLSDDPTQELLSQLRRDRLIQGRVDRRQKAEDRKAMEHARIQDLQNWEDSLLGPEVKDQVKTMWELPQIGLFVYLCMENLGLEEEVTQYQIERGLAVPRECSDFKRLMTCLLSTPHQRKSLKSFMPYHVWNSKLSQKLDYFYKVLSDKRGNQTQACYTLGLDTRAFKVMGQCNPLLKKQFHQLTYLKRVWILKNFCDFCMETQPYLQKTIDETEALRPMDVREVLLGSDSRGNRYINFPMFTGKDIRIYRHPKHPEPSLKSLCMEDWCVDTEKELVVPNSANNRVHMSASSSRCSTPVNPRGSRVAQSASLRARALLQAAESEEPSPLRDVPLSGSEAPEVSHLSPETSPLVAQNTNSASKQTTSRKRKRTSLFFNKRRRLKPNKKEEPDGTGSPDKMEVQDEKLVQGNSGSDVTCSIVANDGRNNSNKSSGDILTNDSRELLEVVDNSNRSIDSISTNKKLNTSNTSCLSVAAPISITDSLSGINVCTDQQSVQLQDSDCINRTASSSSAHLASPKAKETIGEDSDCKISNSVIKCETKLEENIYSSPVDHVTKTELSSDEAAKMCNGGQSSDRKRITGPVICSTKTKMAKYENNSSEFSSVFEQEVSKLNEKMALSNHTSVGSSFKQEVESENSVTSYKTYRSDKCELNEKTETFVSSESKNTKSENIHQKISSSGDGPDPKSEPSECSHPIKVELGEGCGDPAIYQHSSKNKLCQKNPSEDGVCPGIKPEEMKEEETENTLKAEETEEDSDEDDLPPLGRIELVAENMDEIRDLIKRLSNPEPAKRGKKQVTMKACEEELVAAVSRFHDELSKYERSLINARLGMQVKLRKDVESYTEPKVEENNDWDSEQSQSSRDMSDEEDSSSKADTQSAKPPKKSKQKPSTRALLSSAATKLSSITGEENGDSNDSFELDISSRGRLRKRRIIPNNTEDTGLKKRKNLPNQDSFFSSSPTSTTAIITTTTATSTTVYVEPFPDHNLPVMTSTTPHSAIKAQLTAQASRTPGQIGRLLTPSNDNRLKTLRIGTPSGNLSQNLSNIRFVTSLGTAALSRHQMLTSSSAQISHPVMQQLLLNQAKPASLTASVVNTKATSVASEVLLQNHTSGSTQPSSGKMPLAIVPSSVTTQSVAKPSVIMAPQPAAVEFTRVSTSLSQSGKQVLDLSSLSVTQLQQLMKNHAIQINTGSGGPTTLMLTTGFQHQATPQSSGVSTANTSQARLSMEQTMLPCKQDTSGTSLLTLVKPQIVQNNKPSTILTVPKQVPHTISTHVLTARPQTPAYVKISNPGIVATEASLNYGLGSAALQTSLARTMTLVPPMANAILSTPVQSASVSNTYQHITSTTHKPIQAPRIISTMGSGIVALGASNAGLVQTSAPIHLATAINNYRTVNPEALKSRIITVPLTSLSPSKKYAGNVTVKSLIENQIRGTKRGLEEENCEAGDYSQPLGNLSSGANSGLGLVINGGPSSHEGGQVGGILMDRSLSVSKDCSETETFSNNLTMVQAVKSTATSSMIAETDTVYNYPSCSVSSHSASLSHPLWVDTTNQSFNPTTCDTSENILPTVNIKVTSPITVPSLLHDKNGTTIVQSTKVPIQVASEMFPGNSSSPSKITAPISISQILSTQTENISARVQPVSSNLSIMSANSGTNAAVHTIPTFTSASFKLPTSVAGLKNVTLKVTPQCGGSGQFVQGFMTSRGLVIPQTALIQANNHNTVIHTNSINPGTVTKLQSSQAQNPPSSFLETGNPQTINVNGQQGTAVSNQLQQAQSSQKFMAAAPNSLVSSINFHSGILNQNSNLKVMLVNAPSVSTSSPVSNTTTNLNVSNHQQAIATPLTSDLVKQMTNSTHTPSSSTQQVNALSPGCSQQNAVQLLNSIIQGSVGQHNNSSTVHTLGSLPVQTVINAPSVSPQLAAQILALQQNSQLRQGQQPNIVLASKPVQSLGTVSAQNKPSMVTFQLGNLISNLGSVSKLQVGGTNQVQQPQITSAQNQMGTKVTQTNQVLHLGINTPVVAAAQSSQVVRVSNQQSTQLQMSNQGTMQIQPQGNLAIQQQTLLPQHQTQSFIIPQPSLSQQVFGSSHVSTTQQQLSKPHHQPPITQLKDDCKVQQNTGSLIQNQQLINTSQTPGLILSQMQAPTVSVVPGTVSQPHIQFVINSSPASIVNPSTLSPPSCNNQVGSHKDKSNNVSCIVRADSSLIPSSSNSHSPSLLGFSATRSSQSDTGHAMILAGSAVSSPMPGTNKLGSHMIIPSSETGQYLISPVKLIPQNPQTSVQLVSNIHTHTSNTALGLTTGSSMVSGQLSHSTPVRPAVIYAGHPNATDKTEGKIAQILLSQPLQASVPSLSSKQGVNASQNSKTFLYKIGDQYFSSPAATLPQIVPQTTLVTSVMTTPTTSSVVSKSDVQLLVPPSFIEASDQILNQNSKYRTSHSGLLPTQVMTGATSCSNMGNSVLLHGLQSTSRPQTSVRNTLVTNHAPVSVNGLHQTQFSFSLSGPTTLPGNQFVRPDSASDQTIILGTQVSPRVVNHQSVGGLHSQRLDTTTSLHNQHSTNGQAGQTLDKIAAIKQFSDNHNVVGGLKEPVPQRLSAADPSLAFEEQDEKEAALNLLTLANQQI